MASPVIPFYGTSDPEMFALERKAMDRDGLVIDRLDQLLPAGTVVDIGAGNGFTASRLTRPDRTVIALEPSPSMMDRDRQLPWVRGVAQALPFGDGSLDGAYATWAYFFPGIGHGREGLAELDRVVRPGGPLVIVDNDGDDEFCALSPTDVSGDTAWWAAMGFDHEVVTTAFRFDSVEEARKLIGHFFGAVAGKEAELEIEFRVAVYSRPSGGASPRRR